MKIVGSMTTMLKRVLGEQVHLEFQYTPNLPLVCADAGMMEQIIINLAVNAAIRCLKTAVDSPSA